MRLEHTETDRQTVVILGSFFVICPTVFPINRPVADLDARNVVEPGLIIELGRERALPLRHVVNVIAKSEDQQPVAMSTNQPTARSIRLSRVRKCGVSLAGPSLCQLINAKSRPGSKGAKFPIQFPACDRKA